MRRDHQQYEAMSNEQSQVCRTAPFGGLSRPACRNLIYLPACSKNHDLAVFHAIIQPAIWRYNLVP